MESRHLRAFLLFLALATLSFPVAAGTHLEFEAEHVYTKGGDSTPKRFAYSKWTGTNCVVFETPASLVVYLHNKKILHYIDATNKTYQTFDLSLDFSNLISNKQREHHERFLNLFSPIVEVQKIQEEKKVGAWRSSETVKVNVTSVAYGVSITAEYWRSKELPVDIDLHRNGVNAVRIFDPPAKAWLDQVGEVDGVAIAYEIVEEDRRFRMVKKYRLVAVEEGVDVDGEKCTIPDGYREVPADYTQFFAGLPTKRTH